ncbi:MAG: DNA recombination protein RmuC [Acidobacteriota bacterium]|nr:DNA recombination protein RmuC [Acidobacteriota bacterium]
MNQETFLQIGGALIAGTAIGWWLAVALARRRFEDDRLAAVQRVSAAEARAEGEQRRRIEIEQELDEAQITVRRLDRDLAVTEQRARVYEDARRELENAFEALANKALRGNAEQFFALANEKLAAGHSAVAAELDERKNAIEALLAPLRENLDRVSRSTEEIERSRVDAYSRIDEQVRLLARAAGQLDEKTTSLSTALRGPRVQGRWGELTLKNVVQVAGMTEHCDFEQQVSLLDGRRPDMTVHLPGGRQIAVDAKAPLNAYLEASEAKDDAQRNDALDRHVKALRAHVRGLADRSYAETLEADIDLVVLFLPGDSFLSAAFSRDPDLQVEALRSRVLLATPTTLVALLRTVAIYWQQSSLVENAQVIATTARDLYERAAKFGGDLTRLGRGLRTALESYNAAVGSFDRRLMPMARRLEEMQVAEQSKRRVEAPDTVDETVRRSTQVREEDDEIPPN